MVILARLLFPADYGIFGLIQVFTAFIGIFLDSNGILQAAIRGSKDNLKYFENLHTLSLITGIICACSMWILAIPISLFYNSQSLILPSIVTGFTFIFTSLLTVPYASLQQELNFKSIGKIQTISNLIAIIFCGIAAYWGLSYWSLFIREAAFAIVQFIFLKASKKINLHFHLNELKSAFIDIRKLMFHMTGSSIINFFSRNTDNLLIGKIYGGEKLGLYNRAYSLIYLSINLVSGGFNQVLLPSLEKGEISSIGKEYYFSTNLIAFILFPVLLLFNLLPSQVTLLIWGSRWTEIATLLPYIGILIFIQCQFNIIGNVFLLHKKEKYLIWMTTINTIIMVTGIIMGLLSSFNDVIKYYTLFYIALSVPFTIFVVNYMVLSSKLYTILKFWLPKLAVTWIAFSMPLIHQEKNYLAWGTISLLFFTHIFFQEKNMILSILRKRKNNLTSRSNG